MSFKPSINWLLIFIPISVALDRVHVADPILFFSAAVAIVPIARLIVLSTEQIAHKTGDTIGGLLNATFGNAPELIISLVALKAGYVDMVRASLIGAILANLLLATGIAFFLGGLRHHKQHFNATASRTYSTMMLLATVSLIVPSAFSRVFAADTPIPEEAALNIGVAWVLISVYGLYLFFSLKTHPESFSSVQTGHEVEAEESPWSTPRSAATLVGASVLVAWMSEILVGAAEGTGAALGMSEVFIGIVLLAVVGGAAESGSAIAMAVKDKVDLSIGIVLGSSIQIALFVAPVLVLLSQFVGPTPLVLSFGQGEVGSLFLAVLLGTVICADGEANWFKGVQLVTVYTIIALMFYFVPMGAF